MKGWVYSQVVPVYIQAVYVPLDGVLLPRNQGDCLGDFWVLGWNSCLVLSCLSSPLDSHFSCASKQYWPQGQPLTNIQWIAIKRNRLWVWVFPLNNHHHRDREVKQSSNCQPRQWSEKRGREREGDGERGRGKEEYINRLPVTSLFFQGVRFHGQVYGYLWGLSCLVWHAPGLQQ